ncbi:MAG TPA: PQQ-dependent sugar dehydrogenase, partial [Puia sp.]|nr:PQQ-dependent sugar dehydrogenase [Puia sp.]
LGSCNSGKSPDEQGIATDSATIALGQSAFVQQCSGCHNFRQDGIGPALGGITNDVPVDWIQHFIRDPKKMLASGDERTGRLVKKYHTVMPSFVTASDQEIGGIIAFLHTKKFSGPFAGKTNGKALEDPIPKHIEMSSLIVELKLITQFPASSDSGKMPLTRITKFESGPGSDETFVLDLRGKLYRLKNNGVAVYTDLKKLEPKFIPQPGLATGFGSFAFHPAFEKNGLFYTTHTEPARTAKADFSIPDSIKTTLQWVLTEWKADKPGAFPFSGKGRELFRADMVSGIHGVQEISFNPLAKPGDADFGLLYIGIGDGGAVENGFPFLAHSREKIWGTVLRIDPAGRNSSNGQYGIPVNNPFSKNQDSKVLPEIYAYGFRNPHRISWSKSGQMLVCNIGHSNIESLDIIEPGHDYGWPLREGRFLLDPNGNLSKVYALPPDDSLYHVTYPVASYDHDEGKAISGGFEYWGSAIPSLKGKYFFGDIPTGRLFFVDMAALKQGGDATIREWRVSINGITKSLTTLCGSDRVDLHFGRDNRGELYILTKADGKLYRLATASGK